MNPFEIKIPEERMRVMLILALALPAGALMFLVITLVAVKPPAPPLNFDIDTFVLVFFGQVVVAAPWRISFRV